MVAQVHLQPIRDHIVTRPEDFIKDQLPLSQWPVIPTVMKSAYTAVNELVKDTPWLQVQSAKDNKGRLIAYAVDAGLCRAIENGALKCDYRWKDFALPTGRFLELRFSHSTASVSQVADATRQPRSVVFRENARLNNQYAFNFPDFEEENRIGGLPHFLLIHGHQTLDFAHLAVPSHVSKTRYSWRSTNLMNLPHEITSDKPATENTDSALDDLQLLKEDIEKWRRDNDDE